MLIRVLGDLDVVEDDGKVSPITSRSQRAILAVLAAHAGTVISADSLIDTLWGDDPPETALQTLRSHVSRLRGLLGTRAEITASGYRLHAGDELDAARFDRLLDASNRSEGSVGELELLDEALALHRGATFGDVADLELVRADAARLDDLVVSTEERRAGALLLAGRAAEAASAAERVVATHAMRERAWIILIESLGASGRAADALRAYQRAVQALADAGLDPTADLRAAEATVFELSRTPSPAPRALPTSNSSFVGRDDDLAELMERIDDDQIISLVGPGGVGKTRLALALATTVGSRFGCGVRFVELAGVIDGDAVADAVAHGMGLPVGSSGAAAALSEVGQLDILVVVDNCEQVIEAAAHTVQLLTSTGSNIRVVTTSRETLSVDGEHVWPVEPLTVGEHGAAQQLFVERARARGGAPEVDASARETITAIVRLLDGLPLAVEMAAASTQSFTLSEILARLQSEVEPAQGWRRAVPDRHRNLAALVGWSLRLLDPEDRRLCDAMSQFVGRVHADDVASVAGVEDASGALRRLVERSLLVADTRGARATYGMLRVIRLTILADIDAEERNMLAQRHATWVAGALTDADLQLRSPEERAGHARCEQVLGDARLALKWCHEHEPSTAAQICASLHVFGQSRLRNDVLAWAADTLERCRDDSTSAGMVLIAAAHYAANVGDLPGARSLVELATEGGDDRTVASALEVASDIAMTAGDLDAACELAQRGVEAGRRAGDDHCIVVNLVNVVLAHAYAGRVEDAAAALALAPDHASLAPTDQAWLHYADGERNLDRDPATALRALDRAIALADSVESRYVGSVARVSASSVRARTGDPLAMCGPFAELIAHWCREGDRTHLLTTLRNVVPLLERLDLPVAAAELLGTVSDDALTPSFGDELIRLDRTYEVIERELGPRDHRNAYERGAARTIEEAALVAMSLLEARA